MSTDLKSRRLFLTFRFVVRQALRLGKLLDKRLVRAITPLPWPLGDPLRVVDAVHGHRARIVVAIAVPQAAVVHHGHEVVLIPLCRPSATEKSCVSQPA